MRNRHPQNVDGPFYVVYDECIICEASPHEATDVMDTDGYHCFFKRQPESPEETDHAIEAMRVNCCRALRYGGDDAAIIKRLLDGGVGREQIDKFDP